MCDPGVRDNRRLVLRTPKTESGYYVYVNGTIQKEELVKALSKNVKVDVETARKVKYTYNELLLRGYEEMGYKVDQQNCFD